MVSLYFIITKNQNHKTILHDGGGASELLFYTLAYNLSNEHKVVIYNTERNDTIIDNIKYKYIDEKNLNFINNIQNSIIIIQRHFNIAIELHKINPNNKYILWSHDYLEYSFNNLSGNYSQYDINTYYSINNITIVGVSNFHKTNIQSKFPDININVIYNALFPELFAKHENIIINKNNIIFASSWSKGLNNIIHISSEYYKKNPHFKLILLKPSYDSNFVNYPFIECLGNIKNKAEYCKLLQSCLCVLTTSYQETFGCVFAEALHLGVPVIGDNSIKAGFHEIISEDHMCNFRNPQEVIQKINEFQKLYPKVSLDSKFYSKNIIEEWKKLFT